MATLQCKRCRKDLHYSGTQLFVRLPRAEGVVPVHFDTYGPFCRECRDAVLDNHGKHAAKTLEQLRGLGAGES